MVSSLPPPAYSYWTEVVLALLGESTGPVSIAAMSEQTGITIYDLLSTLQCLGLVKYWRGRHVLVPPSPEHAARAAATARHRAAAALDPAALRWTPFLDARPAA
jgi:hypothetical protein